MLDDMNSVKQGQKPPTVPGYLTLGLLAKGGMSRVYLARDIERKRRVAIKIYEPLLQTGATRLNDIFLDEVRILESLHHIHIVTLYDKGELEDGSLYLVMEYLEGGSLHDRIRQRMDEGLALHTLMELTYILQFVHNHGFIHCDIKPANILFRRDHSMVLTDFGIAKPFNHPICREKSSQIIVSPDYASPEQIQGQPFDWRSDLYSAGLIFFEMLTGKNPFRGATMMETLRNHLTIEIPKLNAHFARFQPLVNGMLAFDPDNRFHSLQTCIDEINQLAFDMGSERIPVLMETDEEDIVFFETTQLRAAI